MSELCLSAARAVTLTGCGGGGATKQVKKNKFFSSPPPPSENITILSRLVKILRASVICVSSLDLLPTVTGFVRQEESEYGETEQGRRGLIRSFPICQRRKTRRLSDFLSWHLLLKKIIYSFLSYWLACDPN